MAKKNYVVTGGFGLIGSELVNSLDGNITIISRSEKNKWRIKNKDIRIVLKSINEIDKDDIGDADVIYHLASTVDNYNILTDPYIDSHTNIDGTIRLLEIIKSYDKKPKIIFPSTFFVYGNQYDKTKKIINEESLTDPLGVYPATKLCAENIIKIYSKVFGIPYVIARLTNVYGPQEDMNNPKKGGMNFLIMKAIKGEELNVYNGGNFIRDYIFVTDVVEALRKLEEAENDTFLVGFGKSVVFKDMINYILSCTNNKSKVVNVPPPPFHKAVGIGSFAADTSKLNKLGWSAKVDFKKGIDAIIGRYKTV